MLAKGKLLFFKLLPLLPFRQSSNFCLVYERFGDPSQVLQKITIKNEKTLKSNQVLIRYLASPINPADINTIQGVYPIKPSFPAVGGNEGVAQVIRLGPSVKNLKLGDKVIPAKVATGTWVTYTVLNESDLILVDKEVDDFFAAQLTVNPCTAYRMLKDFCNFKENDSLIQNGANSAVGSFVIQLAKHWKIKTINVVRDRPNIEQFKQSLKSLGADFVITEEELRKKEVMDNILGQIQKPKLALNCVGGQNATDCMRYLAEEGTMVTYGGMSRQPVVIPTGSFIFKNHKYVGFWMSKWSQNSPHSPQRLKMIDELCKLRKEGKLQIPKIQPLKLDDFKKAFEQMSKNFTDCKFIFTFD